MTLPDFLTEDADGYIHVTGHRIGLTEFIHYYGAGFSAEMLREAFPTLTLATVYKLIGFYLENQVAVDEYLVQCRAEIERQRAQASPGPDLNELRRRLAARQTAEA